MGGTRRWAQHRKKNLQEKREKNKTGSEKSTATVNARTGEKKWNPKKREFQKKVKEGATIVQRGRG